MNGETVRVDAPGVTGSSDVAVRGSRVSWSAIIAGAVVSLGLWALLYLFGAAAGLTAMDPNDPSSARVAGIGTGIWSLIAPLIALFVGGLVAARLAGPITRGNGAMHGAVLWGATTIAGVVFLSSLLGSLLGGAASAAKQVVSTTASAASSAGGAGAQAGQALGLDAQDLVAPINQRLRAEGKPEVTAAQLQATLRDVAGSAVRGNLDRERLIASVSQQTALSRADAEQVATTIEQRFTSLRARGSEQLEQVKTGALQAADTTGKVLWGAFGALLLGLLAALGGGAVGAHARDRRTERTTSAPTAARPVARPGEVYP